MPKEDPFVAVALKVADNILGGDLIVRRSKSILYQVTVDNKLKLTVEPKWPKRGQSAFQTDLCVFEKIEDDIEIPRVVIEFKSSITTHDVLTYSTKAKKHKQVYPYLRYGMLISKISTIPGRVYTHNESLDFVVCAGGVQKRKLRQLLETLLKKEIKASRTLEKIYFGKSSGYIFRNSSEIDETKGKVF